MFLLFLIAAQLNSGSSCTLILWSFLKWTKDTRTTAVVGSLNHLVKKKPVWYRVWSLQRMIYGWALRSEAWQTEGYNMTHHGRGGDKKHSGVGHKRSWCADLLPGLRSCLLWVHRACSAVNLAGSSSSSSSSRRERGHVNCYETIKGHLCLFVTP